MLCEHHEHKDVDWCECGGGQSNRIRSVIVLTIIHIVSVSYDVVDRGDVIL